MKVVKGGRSEKKGGESKKESLVKSSMFMLCYVMFMFMFSHGHGYGYGGWKVQAHVKSYQVKGSQVWASHQR